MFVCKNGIDELNSIRYLWIEAFHAVALSGTTVGAAELLGIGQPAVSRHVASLERRLGLELFQRESRSLRLTAEGEHLLAEASDVLDGMSRFVRTADELRHMRRGHLSIVASSPIARGLLPPALRTFREAHPNITVALETVPRRELARRLESQHFDLGFVALPCDYPDEGLLPIAGFNGMCILPPGHPMAAAEVVHLRDLHNEPLIGLPTSTVWRMRVDAAFDELGLSFAPVVEAQVEIGDLVRAGIGLAIVDPFTAQTAQISGVIVRPLMPEITYEMAILFPVTRARSRLAQALAAQAQQTAVALQTLVHV